MTRLTPCAIEMLVLIEERHWTAEAGWLPHSALPDAAADLVIYFGSRRILECEDRYLELRTAYPRAKLIGCSATRSIRENVLDEDILVAVSLRFARTAIAITHRQVTALSQSREAGTAIGTMLAGTGLSAIFLLADSLRVDGSELVAGICDATGPGPLIFGGMASDPRDYQTVLVGGDCAPQSGAVAAVGFYGDAIRFSNGCASGWDAFGPSRRITRSKGNVLYDLDGKPAYDLYRRYLGDELLTGGADGVVFPLQISQPHDPARTLVRAPLAIDDDPTFMTFAGHVPQGWNARLMRANADRLIFGAADAARRARTVEMSNGPTSQTLALIISCAGRHQVMGQRTEEELEVAGAELAPAKRIGFYSFGEIAPMARNGRSEVHNQTISITNVFELGN